MTEKQKIVLPGDLLGTAEEFFPSEGAYEENGKIYSKFVGVPEYNLKEKTVKIKSKNPPVVLKEGDIVIGTISDLKEQFVIVEISNVLGKTREISSETYSSLHISRISEDYVQDIRQQFRIGDIIKAKVIQTAPTLQISTVGKEFGVLKAFCGNCRASLKTEKNKLVCKKCERTEFRKGAADYGRGIA